jgi:hypothetical protein
MQPSTQNPLSRANAVRLEARAASAANFSGSTAVPTLLKATEHPMAVEGNPIGKM